MMLIGTVGQTIILEVAQDEDGYPATAPIVSVVNAATGASILASQTMTLDGTVWKYSWDTTGLGTSYLQARVLYVVDGAVYPEAVQLNAVSGGGGGAAPAISAPGGVRLLRAGDTYRATFTTLAATGAAADADSLPTGAVKRNGAADGAVTVTVVNDSTGQYSASFTAPTSYNNGDIVELVISATIGAIVAKAPGPSAVVISKMAFDDLVTLGDNTRVLELDGTEWRERRYAPGDAPGTPSIQDSHVTDAYGAEIRNLRSRELAARGVNEA